MKTYYLIAAGFLPPTLAAAGYSSSEISLQSVSESVYAPPALVFVYKH